MRWNCSRFTLIYRYAFVGTANADPLVNFRKLELPKATYFMGRQPLPFSPAIYRVFCHT